MKRFFRWLLYILVFLAFFAFTVIVIIPKIAPPFGGRATGEYLETLRSSPNFNDGKFVNLQHTPMNSSGDSLFSTFLEFLKGDAQRSPDHVIESAPFENHLYAGPDSSIVMTWFGHSTVLLKIGGKKLLIDPVFSNHASPFAFMGPKAFPYSSQYSVDDLPAIDAVLISHDHYDHLDYETMLLLRERVNRFFVPLGLSAHLLRWGIPRDHITEMDWWDEIYFEDLLLACVPMRHFSGRGITDRFCTLWAGWVIRSDGQSVVHTGDSGYGPHFREIGKRYGPFDLTMVECGQYNENWKHIHMMPEETVQAHLDLRGRYLLPIHWGRFNLALHGWTDPITRALQAAEEKDVAIITPLAGQTFSIRPPLPGSEWWKKAAD